MWHSMQNTRWAWQSFLSNPRLTPHLFKGVDQTQRWNAIPVWKPRRQSTLGPYNWRYAGTPRCRGIQYEWCSAGMSSAFLAYPSLTPFFLGFWRYGTVHRRHTKTRSNIYHSIPPSVSSLHSRYPRSPLIVSTVMSANTYEMKRAWSEPFFPLCFPFVSWVHSIV